MNDYVLDKEQTSKVISIVAGMLQPKEVKDIPDNAKLCYITYNSEETILECYFTTDKLTTQWGDDWDNAPYEHNSAKPYTPLVSYYGGGKIILGKEWVVDEDNGSFKPSFYIFRLDVKPDNIESVALPHEALCNACGKDTVLNSSFSVEDINAGCIPWLTKKYKTIFAGANAKEVWNFFH